MLWRTIGGFRAAIAEVVTRSSGVGLPNVEPTQCSCLSRTRIYCSNRTRAATASAGRRIRRVFIVLRLVTRLIALLISGARR